MKKTLLVTAIAGALGASSFAAQAATVYNQDGTQLDIYGNIQIAYYSIDTGDDSEDALADNGSTFGFAAQHVINDGLTGYLRLEFNAGDATDFNGDTSINGDEAYVGLKGNFGDVRLGTFDSLMDQWIQDPLANYEFLTPSDSGHNDEGEQLQYTSPSFGGLVFAVGTQYEGSAERGFADGTMNDNDTPVDLTDDFPNIEGESQASFFGGAKYTVGAFSVAAVYDDMALRDTLAPVTGDEAEFGDQYGVTAQYTMGALTLTAKAERFAAEQDDSDVDFFGLSAYYGYGNGAVYAAVQEVNPEADGADSRTELLGGGTYNISSAMYVWAEAGMYDQDDDLGDFVATGVTYSF